MAQKKYASLTNLQTFLNNLKTQNIFVKTEDYVVDSALSSTSTNPVQNKVIDAEFEAISEAYQALESEIDNKADASHNHNDIYYTETEIDTQILGINQHVSSVDTSVSNIVNGTTKVPKAAYADTAITASAADTAVTANSANSATKATQDGDGKVISFTYETKIEANTKLDQAKSYADTAASTAANTVKNDLLNGAGGAYDTLKELGELIDDNTDAINALETVAAGKADASHTHDDKYYTETETDNKFTVVNDTIDAIVDGTTPVAKATNATNADNASKLTTARTITPTTAVVGTATSFDGSADIELPITQVKEAYLDWGGRDITNSVSPLDAALISEMGANRIAFMPPEDIEVEYSRDGGVTWVNYDGFNNEDRVKLVSVGSQNLIIGGTANNVTTNYMSRVTISANNFYFLLRKAAIFVSTVGSGNAKAKIELLYNGRTDYELYKEVPVAGYSGWNIIQFNHRFGASSSSNVKKIRFTFSIGTITTGYTNAFSISKLYMYGETQWGMHCTYAEKGTVYGTDWQQNVTFPAKVTATGGFVGNLTGNADSATKASKDANGNVITDTYAKKSDVNSAVDNINLSKFGITATSNEINALDGVTSNVQEQLNGKAPAYTYGTDDMTAGTTALETGKLYFVYE